MPFVRVHKPYLNRGRYYRQGELITISEFVLKEFGDHVEVIGSNISPKAAHLMQKNASDFVRFCMAHQNTYPDGRCPIRQDRMDPLSRCLGWKLKKGALIK